jgi:hypothetical protein
VRIPALLAGGALVLAVAAGLYVGTFAGYTHAACSVGSGGRPDCVVITRTVVGENGSWVVVLLAAPAVLCAASLVALTRQTRARSRLALGLAAVLLAGSIVTGFSIGLPFLPAALLLMIAALLDQRPAPVRV